MVRYSRISRRTRRYKRKRQWANASRLAKRAYVMAKKLQPEVRLIETAKFNTGRIGSLVSGTVVQNINPLYAMNQGTGIDERQGHKLDIKGYELEMDWSLVAPTGTRAFLGSDVKARCLLIQVHDYHENSYVTPGDVFSDTTLASDGLPDAIYSNYKSKASYLEGNERTRKFTVLYDKVFHLYDHSGRDKFEQHKRVMIRRNIRQIMYGGGGGPTILNPIQLMVFADNGDTLVATHCGIQLRWQIKCYFQDR